MPRAIGLVASVGEILRDKLTLISLLLDFDRLGEVLLFLPLDSHPNRTIVDIVSSVAELILRNTRSAMNLQLVERTYLVVVSLLKYRVLKERVRCKVEEQFESRCVIRKILQADIDQKGKSCLVFLSDC